MSVLVVFSGVSWSPSAIEAVDLGLGAWPTDVRERLETMEARGWHPEDYRRTRTAGGIVSATVSPVAVEAGLRALDAGGTAADAAVTVALTQVATQLGSVVSYAGIATALYYDASSGRVHALDAGYTTYADETDPLSIPPADLGALRPTETSGPTDAHGRKTLVPGFMAGMEALHRRYGRLAFGELFAPAIACADEGVVVSPILAGFFAMRAESLARTAEGRAFLGQSGRSVPQAGDRFRQPALASLLRAVAAHGAREMYTGAWAREFVAVVRREGGRVTEADLERYEPVWSEAFATEFAGHATHVTPLPNLGAYALAAGLHLADHSAFSERRPVWEDAHAWAQFARICAIATSAPMLGEETAARLRDKGVEPSPEAFLSPEFAARLAEVLTDSPPLLEHDRPRHSNALVVVDAAGNVCALTHTINAVVWGGTGIVVGGVPLPDSAGFQQARLAHVAPGGRVPHEIVDTISLREGRPVLATAGIGSSLAAETLRILVSTLAQKAPLADVLAAPNMLSHFGAAPIDAARVGLPVPVLEGWYAEPFLESVRAYGVSPVKVTPEAAEALRGTIVVVALDAESGTRVAVERPDIMVHHAARALCTTRQEH
ncbi:gamma-glutamyltransferase [Opitutales bacterium ASA1]|uniref:gamma-glutamyltransferase n=1 Tax=Congregicoccus parvus TaxID=3081749 RepID=UPI002B27CF32|nr:gamma-glutamyltransferase [Opitutales bacterium ASA1]